MSDPVKTVLFVDDESFIRQSFADYFEDHLWETFQEESGEAALELLENASPDGAIVDVRMGGMDGNNFIREAIKKNHRMAFIICTGSPEYVVPDDLKKMECVSNQLFKKPVTDMSELEQVLSALIVDLGNKTKGEG